MALIAMCAYSTDVNKKDQCLFKTLRSLENTVDFSRHRLMITVNGHTDHTKNIINQFSNIISKTYWNNENVGTAKGINQIWANRLPEEHCHKMDDDIETDYKGWLDELEEVINNDITIGQAALKRMDLWENPAHENPFYRSTLQMMRHEPGKRWWIVEEVNHCMGSSVLHSWRLIDKVGGLRQPLQYGLDDSLQSAVSKLSGFRNVFLPHIPIAHLDLGDTEFQKEKELIASKSWEEYHRLLHGYKDGSISMYKELV